MFEVDAKQHLNLRVWVLPLNTLPQSKQTEDGLIQKGKRGVEMLLLNR
jgi:hypothetical protein